MQIFGETVDYTVLRKTSVAVLICFWMSLVMVPQLEGKLLGDHICQMEITVTHEVPKWELENRTHRIYEWCLNYPPRCSKYIYSVANVTKIAVINVTKSVEACCEGFREQNNLCVSNCANCQNGLCLKGSCVCQKGWNGPHCDTRTASDLNESKNVSQKGATIAQERTKPRLPLDDLPKNKATTKSSSKENVIPSSYNPPFKSNNETALPTTTRTPSTNNPDLTSATNPKVNWDDQNNSLEKHSSTIHDNIFDAQNLNTKPNGEIIKSTPPTINHELTSSTFAMHSIVYWDDHNNSLEMHHSTQNNINFSNKYPIPPSTQTSILKHLANLHKVDLTTKIPQYFNIDTNLNEELEGSGFRHSPKIEITASPPLTQAFDVDSTATKQVQHSSVPFMEGMDHFNTKEEDNESIESFLEGTNIETDGSVIDYRELNADTDMDAFEEAFFNNTSTAVKQTDVNTNDVEVGKSTVSSVIPLTKQTTSISFDHHDVKENNVLLREPDDFTGERYEKRSSMENNQLSTTESVNKKLIYLICAAVLTTFLVLVVLVTWYAVRNSRKKVERDKAKEGVVAVYKTSIFHSPLPDPPTFENPTYLAVGTPAETHYNRGCSWMTAKKGNVEVQELSFMHTNPTENPKREPVYDHPPSTGSYMACSTIDALSQYNLSQNSVSSTVVLEPLYQEIQFKDMIYANSDNSVQLNGSSGGDQKITSGTVVDPNGLYMNTFGRTMF